MSLNEGVKRAIIEYVEVHSGADSSEIVNHVGIRCDIALHGLHELETEGLIGRYLNGSYFLTCIARAFFNVKEEKENIRKCI